MTDKEMIEEMARVIFERGVALDGTDFVFGLNGSDHFERIATAIYNAGYRKIPEGSVVLSEGEYSDILEDEVKTLERDIAEYWVCLDIDAVARELHKDGYRKLDDHAIMTLRKAKGLEERTRKETAREILTKINNHLKRYAHIHKHAEEAKKSTEAYADGTPVEMESVWDVITLNKNGYDDYETMCKLEDNIRNLALSKLLQEFEKDFRLFVRELGVEVEE